MRLGNSFFEPERPVRRLPPGFPAFHRPESPPHPFDPFSAMNEPDPHMPFAPPIPSAGRQHFEIRFGPDGMVAGPRGMNIRAIQELLGAIRSQHMEQPSFEPGQGIDRGTIDHMPTTTGAAFSMVCRVQLCTCV